MARITIGFGLVLCTLTVLVLLLTPANRLSAEFIPMIFGLPLFICGVISLNPHRRRSWIRLAALISVLGASGAGTRLLFSGRDWIAGQSVQSLSNWLAAFLLVFLLVYAGISVRFIRRSLSNSTRSLTNSTTAR